MAASTITRTTWVDDDGTGTTGTVVRNAELQLIYDKIDLLFSALGIHSFEAGGAGANELRIVNTSSGAGIFARARVEAGTTLGLFDALSQGWTTSGSAIQSGVRLLGNGAGGVQYDAGHASGTHRWYINAVEMMRMYATGGVTLGSPTGGDKGAGTINAIGIYDDNVLLTDWVYDLYYDGKTSHAKPAGARLYPLNETHTITASERRLPWMPTRLAFEHERAVGKMITRLWFGQEQQQIYIDQLEARIAALEAA